MSTETVRRKNVPRIGGLVAVCLLLALAAGAASFTIAKATWSTARTTSGEVDARAAPPDMDGDGIANEVDLEPLVVSGAFSDEALGGTSFGVILDRGGLTVEVTEEPNPDGVRIAVSGSGGPAALSVCNIVTLDLSEGDDLLVTCASASVVLTVKVLAGPVGAVFGPFGASLPTGAWATIVEWAPGIFEVSNAPDSATSITVNGIEIPPGATEIDDDGDGFFTSTEQYLGTDPLDACPDDGSDDAWPLDVNHDGEIHVVTDVLNFRDRIGETPGAPNWWQRLDFNTDGMISVVGDVLMYRERIGEACT